MGEPTVSSGTHPATAAQNSCVGEGADTHVGVALVAPGRKSVEPEDALVLTDIEARLTNEVRRLVGALAQFGHRAQCIREEVPLGADFTKAVTSLLALLSFQLANALGKGLDKPILFDDGRQYLAELGLGLEDFIREVHLDGRRFLAIALVEQGGAEILDRGDAGNEG